MGTIIGILIILGIGLSQWNSLIGLLGITSNAVFETFALFFPGLTKNQYALTLVIAIVIIGTMYGILLTGKFSVFEKVLTIFVSIMGICFIAANFIEIPDPKAIALGMVPELPKTPSDQKLMVAMVGTTMAAATFISRPLFIQGKKWTLKDMKLQQTDARNAALLIFFVCAAIMSMSMATLYESGKTVEKVLDMVYTLEPIAGKFAIVIFLLGTLSAGISSIFPMLMIAPLMIADFTTGKLDIKSTQFRIITGIACVIGLTVPLIGGNPIEIQILTQVFLVLVLPLVVGSILVLINRKS